MSSSKVDAIASYESEPPAAAASASLSRLESAHNRDTRGISIRVVFVAVCVLQVTVCAALCCYLGYSNAIRVTNELSGSILDLHFRLFRTTVDQVLIETLRSTDAIQEHFEKLIPTLISTNYSGAAQAGFWGMSSRRFRRNWALGSPVREIYSCSLGNLSYSFIPIEDRQTMLLTDVTTGSRTSAIQLRIDSAKRNDWRDIQADLPPDTTFDSMLKSDKFMREFSVPRAVSDRLWWREIVASQSAFIWPHPFSASMNTSFLFGNGKRFSVANLTHPVAVCSTQFSVGELRAAMSTLELGKRSHFMLLRNTGALLVASEPQLHAMHIAAPEGRLWLQNHTEAGSLPAVQVVSSRLKRWGLMSQTADSTSISACTDPTVFSARVSVAGSTFLMRAACVGSPGLDGVLVTLSPRSDFDDGSSELLTYSLLVGSLLLGVSVMSTVVVVNVVWRKVDQVVHFMRELDLAPLYPSVTAVSYRASEIPAKGRLHDLVRRWDAVFFKSNLTSGESGTPSGFRTAHATSGSQQNLIGDTELSLQHPFRGEPVYVAANNVAPHAAIVAASPSDLQVNSASSSSVMLNETIRPSAARPLLLSAVDAGRVKVDAVIDIRVEDQCVQDDSLSASNKQRCRPVLCELSEPALMRRTFGSMLHALSRFEQETAQATQTKRHFIRYIFHEVRVPFNSVTLCKQ